MADGWDRVLSTVDVVGDNRPAGQASLEEARQALGLSRLPPSYVRYVREFGPGSWGDELLIGVPCLRDSGHDLWSMVEALELRRDALMGPPSENLPKELRDIVLRGQAEDFKERDLLERLVSFGELNTELLLCWDPAQQTDDGEIPVVLATEMLVPVLSCGVSFLDFLLEFWIDGKINGVLQGSPFESRNVFTVFGVDCAE